MRSTQVSADLVVVAGVPGAGKSTAMRGVAGMTMRGVAGTTTNPRLVLLDSDRWRIWLLARLPDRTPYRWYRPVTHLLHQSSLLLRILAGPRARLLGGRTMLVHDPGTRRWWRDGIGRLARARGWRTCLVYLDVSRQEALCGQLARGRVVDPGSFAGHWRRWERLRELVGSSAAAGWPGWDRVRTTTRAEVVEVLLAESGAPDRVTAKPPQVMPLGSGAQRVRGRLDDELAGQVEPGVEQHRHTGERLECPGEVRERWVRGARRGACA